MVEDNTYKFNNEQKELSRRIDALNGRMNRIELIFEHNRDCNNKIVAAMQSGDPTVFKMALEATEKATGAFKS